MVPMMSSSVFKLGLVPSALVAEGYSIQISRTTALSGSLTQMRTWVLGLLSMAPVTLSRTTPDTLVQLHCLQTPMRQP